VTFRLILAACAVFVAADAAAADAARGRAKSESCTACHGSNGFSEMEKTPSLAGQPEPFLNLQLFLFREKLRDVPAMQAAVQDMTDVDAADLSAFYAALPPPQLATTPSDAALIARGTELAQRLRCGSCHLPDYAGREQIPRLSGQREDYMLHAMIEYRDNRRMAADTNMTAVLHGLSDADLAALAHTVARPPR
jgi:cytochrome c553